MLFSAGIGIGLVYWGTAEPLYHFMAPPLGEAETLESAKQAMNLSFLHWGLLCMGDLYYRCAVARVFPFSPWPAIIDTLNRSKNLTQT